MLYNIIMSGEGEKRKEYSKESESQLLVLSFQGRPRRPWQSQLEIASPAFGRLAMTFFVLYISFLFPFKSFPEKVVGKITLLEGDVDITRNGNIILPKPGDDVFEGDIVRTKRTGFAKIFLIEDGSEIELTKLSRFEIEKIEENLKEFLLKRGKLKAEVKPQKGKFFIRTSNAVAGVKGTIFFITTNWSSTSLFVREGRISFANIELKGQVELNRDQISFVYRGRPPVPPRSALQFEIDDIIKDFEKLKEKGEDKKEEKIKTGKKEKEEMIKKQTAIEQKIQLKKEDVGSQIGGVGFGKRPEIPEKPQPPPITEKDKKLRDLLVKKEMKEKEMKVKVKVK